MPFFINVLLGRCYAPMKVSDITPKENFVESEVIRILSLDQC